MYNFHFHCQRLTDPEIWKPFLFINIMFFFFFKCVADLLHHGDSFCKWCLGCRRMALSHFSIQKYQECTLRIIALRPQCICQYYTTRHRTRHRTLDRTGQITFKQTNVTIRLKSTLFFVLQFFSNLKLNTFMT